MKRYNQAFGIVICLTILSTTPGIVLNVALISLLTAFIALRQIYKIKIYKYHKQSVYSMPVEHYREWSTPPPPPPPPPPPNYLPQIID
jgi:hypothetical protein